jgi:sigma-B regulation protein RsbU (phosphoserine phosphatase)
VEEVQLASGDVLVLFTDGVTEAKNQADEEYSDARLEALIRNMAGERSGRIIQTITDDVREFAHGADQSDDITIMVLTIT